jgi:hypothetical protein
MFDVVEVEIATGKITRVMERNKDDRNAEAIVNMAVVRRGVKEYFFARVIAGKYRDGDEYVGTGTQS